MREQFFGRKVLVYGYGVSGKGAEKALLKCGARVTVVEDGQGSAALFGTTPECHSAPPSRPAPPNPYSSIPICNFELVVTSPSIPLTHAVYQSAHEKDVEIYGEAELGARLYGGFLVAVTGTNGKTTVTRLIGEIFRRAGISTAVCGNIGVSFAEESVSGEAEAAVVELSSFQLESVVSLKPDIAIITNLSPDHLDRHGDFQAYAAAKLNIAKNQVSPDTLILSQDDIPLSALEGFCPNSNVLYTSTRGKVRGAYLLDDTLYFLGEPIIKRPAVKLFGAHNLSNCLFALCAAKLKGIENHTIAAVLSEFEPDGHRLKFVAHSKGKNYYNDSKGTNIGATLAAARAMNGATALILGGKDKGYEFDALFENLPMSVTHIFVIGETSEKIYAAACRNGFRNIKTAPTLEGAVILSAATDAENVLLSPACSSFDMFHDYEERGRAFETAVHEI